MSVYQEKSRWTRLPTWYAKCDRDKCYYLTGWGDNEQAARNALERHQAVGRCPLYTPTKVGLLVSQTLLQKAWHTLDALTDQLMQTEVAEDKTPLQNQARGMATILAIFMTPHFRTADDIAREARRRWQARKAGEHYETPGLGERAWEVAAGYNVNAKLYPPGDQRWLQVYPNPCQCSSTAGPTRGSSKLEGFRRDDNTGCHVHSPCGLPVRAYWESLTGATAPDAPESLAGSSTPPRTRRPAVNLTEQERTAIKFAFDSQMFTVEQLAATYKITPAAVRDICEGANA